MPCPSSANKCSSSKRFWKTPPLRTSVSTWCFFASSKAKLVGPFVSRTLNALLEIAQAEAGSYRGDWEQVDLSALATDIGLLYQAQTEANQQCLALSITPGIPIRGNWHLLGQLINNLLENAHTYALLSKRNITIAPACSTQYAADQRQPATQPGCCAKSRQQSGCA